MPFLWINGQQEDVVSDAPLTVKALIETLGHEEQSVAVAIDGEMVARHDYAEMVLHDGQNIEILRPMQGG